MANIKQVQVVDGLTTRTVPIEDAEARARISALENSITSVTHLRGYTTTAMYDGLTTRAVIIGGAEYTAQDGDVVIYKTGNRDMEYVWTNGSWHEYGSTGSLKNMAFTDSASGQFTPSGNVNISGLGVSTTVGSSRMVKTTVYGVGNVLTTHDTPTLNKESIGSASGWNAGSMFTAAYDENTGTLTLTAGTAPQLTITQKSVGTSLSAGTAQVVAVAGSGVMVATGDLASDGQGSEVVTSVGAALSGSVSFVGTRGTVTVTAPEYNPQTGAYLLPSVVSIDVNGNENNLITDYKFSSSTAGTDTLPDSVRTGTTVYLILTLAAGAEVASNPNEPPTVWTGQGNTEPVDMDMTRVDSDGLIWAFVMPDADLGLIKIWVG